MQNIFPIAQKAFIEQTIGHSRPSGMIPMNQIPKEPSFNYEKSTLFKIKPNWFKMNEISEIEKNFSRMIKIDEEEYLQIRNLIIKQYEESSSYIPFNSILNIENENNNFKARIFDFLEDHKIINFQNDLSHCLEKLTDERTIQESIQKEIQESAQKESKIIENYIEKEDLKNSRCSCGEKAFYFTSNLVFVCDSCFNLGKYPKIYSPRNFHCITENLINSIWTKQEEYILLKNIETVGDDWSKVCEGLNKTVEQCIFHFIKMSIVDDITQFPTPFTQVPNPVSTLIAFVCSIVYPSISTELAKNAILHLNDPNLMQILLKIAKEKSEEVLEMEMKKKGRLENVEIEAMIKRIILKVEAINEMNGEMQIVKNELEDEREKLMREG